MVLDGLIRELDTVFVRFYKGRRHTNRFMLNAVRYADDFVITGATHEFLEDEVVPRIKRFLAERGLRLSPTKTRIIHIREGFDFLGYTVRKFGDKLNHSSLKGERDEL